MMQQEIIQGYRLSPQQRHLWLLQQSDRGLPYHARCAVGIDGDLKPEVLEKAIRHVVSQHEILRTTFKRLAGMTIPVQVISDRAVVSLDRHNLTGFAVEDQYARIEACFLEAVDRAIDFERLPLLYGDLIELSSSQHVLILSLPSMCADGPTLHHFVGQTAAAYAAYTRGEEPSSIVTMQFADFAEWQNELIESPEATTGRQYWKQQDLSAIGAEGLPCEKRVRETGVVSNHRHDDLASLPIEFQVESFARIRTIAERSGVPVSCFLLACWQTLIWRLTGRSGVVIGTAFDGRKFSELEGAIGLFSSYLPIKCDLFEDLSFSELLRKVGERDSEAQKRQEYFVCQPAVPSDEDAAPRFFSLCFETHRRPEKFSADGLAFMIFKQDARISRFKMRLICEEAEAPLFAKLQYDSSLFSSTDVRRLADQLRTLIEDASNRPEVTLGELEVLSDDDRHLLLVEFNDTRKEYPKGQCVHEMFEYQAEQRPDHVAVVCEAERLTFGELNARANRLAHHLIKRGVGPDVAVGLCLHRSAELIVALLGILKAGGAYVPLDPGLPKGRLGMMLEDAGVRVLVTRCELAEGLRGQVDSVVYLDEDHDLLEAERQDSPISRGCDQNLVYVIFTSGSTGRPKGVAVEHRQLVNYVNAIWERLDLPLGSSFATVSTIAADLGNTGLFPPLLKGGSLHLISEERAADPDALAEYFVRNQIDCLKIVPSHLFALLSSSNPADVLPRQRLVLGGEACPWKLVEQITALSPDCVILNHYGPTEATVGSTTYRVEGREPDRTSETVSLGRPIANTQAFILDKRLRPVPIGGPGELHLSGAGLARGYINRAGSTAEKFIPNSFSGAGSRLYKTGDLARYRGDGQIEFLGRSDDQVKIHGYRIEPGEIELALREYGPVAASVVVAREDQPAERRLVAYVVAHGHGAVDSNELRTFLKGRLPEYMIPSAFVSLERLPLTPNGKVDRRALPAPDRLASTSVFAVPRTQFEETLAQIWANVLSLDRVGINDNFFDLGGDSILSIQIIARANQAGLRLSPRQLFQYQTVAGLAAVAEIGPVHEAEPVTLPRDRGARDAASYSASDFPQAKLSQEDLNKVLARLGGSQKKNRK